MNFTPRLSRRRTRHWHGWESRQLKSPVAAVNLNEKFLWASNVNRDKLWGKHCPATRSALAYGRCYLITRSDRLQYAASFRLYCVSNILYQRFYRLSSASKFSIAIVSPFRPVRARADDRFANVTVVACLWRKVFLPDWRATIMSKVPELQLNRKC